MLSSYTVRESRRAKHVSLKMSVAGNLEIIVPQGFDRKHIPEILQRKQGWIEQVTQRMQLRQSLAGAETIDGLPQEIVFRAIDETWQVDYRSTNLPGVRLNEQPASQLVLFGETTHREVCKATLQKWVARKARMHLVPWLRSVSKELRLPFEDASIRRQKTRWGSCSATKTISLNSKLLFLPSHLVRYILIHELCHTVHLNHSRQFWALVGSHEPDYRQFDTSLRDARLYVPLWMEE